MTIIMPHRASETMVSTLYLCCHFQFPWFERDFVVGINTAKP